MEHTMQGFWGLFGNGTTVHTMQRGVMQGPPVHPLTLKESFQPISQGCNY